MWEAGGKRGGRGGGGGGGTGGGLTYCDLNVVVDNM